MLKILPSAALAIVYLVLLPAGAGAQGLLPSSPEGWSVYAPRPVIAPGTSSVSGATAYTLQIDGSTIGGVSNVSNTPAYGGWTTRITGLTGGSHYRFTARAVATNIVSLRESVTIALRWTGSFGEEVAPDYVWDFQKQPDGSLLFGRTLQTPSGTTGVDVRLVLQWSPGQLAFDQLGFAPATAPGARKVRVAAIHYRPSGSASGFDSVKAAADYARTVAVNNNPDVMVMGELLNHIGAPGSLDVKAETATLADSPSIAYVAKVAADTTTYIAFGMVEREGSLLYNTAILLDPKGQIAGKHRKVQLPLSDAAAGLYPGNSVPVFDTSFGRIAILICQDMAFTEAAREAALKGAELLLVPIWGGKTALVRARAIENSVYMAAAGYDYPTEVVNPLGTVVASVRTTGGGGKAAIADIDLNQRFRETYLGDWRDISNKERRSEPYQYLVP